MIKVSFSALLQKINKRYVVKFLKKKRKIIIININVVFEMPDFYI